MRKNINNNSRNHNGEEEISFDEIKYDISTDRSLRNTGNASSNASVASNLRIFSRK
jgi:hypothetical protein